MEGIRIKRRYKLSEYTKERRKKPIENRDW
jgi:hypothetical protein